MSYPRPPAGSISSTASNVAAWCRKTFFGSKEHQTDEVEPLKGVTLSETEADVGVVEECPICTTALKSKLCAAVPCNHEACERCWSSWQKQGHKTCMICALPIKSIHHPSNARLSKNKGSYFAKAADEALEDALRAMLRIKNELLEIVEKVDETQSHLSFLLQNAQLGVFDSDSATSIVQVEVSTTHEQLDRLLRTAALLPEVDKTVQLLNRAIRELEAVALAYGDLGDWSRSTLINFADVLILDPKSKRTALSLQWKAVTDLFSDLLTARLNVVQAMAMVMPMEGMTLLTMLERARTGIVSGLPPINEKVQHFEYDARRFMDTVHTANLKYPLHAELLLSGPTAESAKATGE